MVNRGKKKKSKKLEIVTDKKEAHEKREVTILKSKLVFWNLNLAQFIADPDKRDGYLIQNCSCEDCILLKKAFNQSTVIAKYCGHIHSRLR